MQTTDINELQVIFKITYGHLSNGNLYNLLRTNKDFRNKFWQCDKRLTKWYLRDHGRIWKA